MPTRPATHQPTFHKTPEQRRAAERERFRERDRERPSAADRGYDDDWRALRWAFLAEHPTCSVDGCNEPATDVDHIVGIREDPSRRLDITNLRSFCHRHHSQRTARDQSFNPLAVGRAARHPAWFRPSNIPLRIVCGPRGAGKSTYVDQHADPSHLIIDLDSILADVSGTALYETDGLWLDVALRKRNDLIGSLSGKRKFNAAWIVLGEPHARWRPWWCERLHPVSMLVLDTPADVCHARIDDDPRRDRVRSQHHEHVTHWWSHYAPAPGDRRIRHLSAAPHGGQG